MGTTTTLVTLEEYLNTAYEPDMDFVDGVLVRRNVGPQLHGLLQIIVGSFLRQFRQSHRITAFTETRLLVDAKTNRHRIPDVMAVENPFQKGRVVVDVPAIVVEIKSPDDTFDDIVDRCFDYEQLGVVNILVMDPDNKRAWLFEHGDLRLLTGESVSLNLRERPTLDLPFCDMFAELEEGE
jgi:Uma2 family endonuclease